VEALQSGRLGGLALLLYTEPADPAEPAALRDRNVILMPHTAVAAECIARYGNAVREFVAGDCKRGQ
jgi:lactate dehydrogenase-like 2-hydroxyacid dehydrogenase